MGTAQVTPRDTNRTRQDTTIVVPVPARADTLSTDSTRVRADTTAADSARLRPDSIQAPISRAETPLALEIGRPFTWNREALFASGALTLLDLLERVPGITGYRSGWLLGPEAASLVGEFGRVRVFYDGVELDALNPRMGGQLDLSTLELWTLEELTLERGPGEIRVYARSWRVRRVTPDSRVDVSTGDLRTNVFRGFFGKRWRHGELLQVGGQQYSTTNPNNTDGDQLSVFVRGGLARDRWSVDAYALTTSRLRNAQLNFLGQPPLSPLDSRNLLYYLRAGIGDPSAGGAWAQVIASSQRFDERTDDPTASGQGASLPRDTVDTLVKRAQYVATGGYTSGPLRVSGALRLRTPESATLFSPSARAEWAQPLVAAAAFVERSAEDSTLRAEATVRVQPVPFVSLVGAASQASPFDDLGERSTVNSLRVEAGVQVKDLWLSGGVLSRSSAPIRPPIVYDTALVGGTRQTTGAFARVSGRVWRDVSATVVGTQWDEDATLLGYLPRQQVRSEITLDTRWLSRFPRGNFGLRASFTHEYRSQVVFPIVDESLVSPSHSLFSGLLEIHIEDAVVMLQVRNLSNVQYFSVPGYLMPPTTLIYGVRWQFWN